MTSKRFYSDEPDNKHLYTQKFNRFYSQFGHAFDRFVKVFPIWRNWLNQAIPHLQGEQILEVSFGTGYLLAQYADRFQTCGIDYNPTMAGIARKNLDKWGIWADLQLADVEALPYANETFDTLVNTMSFSGYPDGECALSEMRRVLKNGGRLVMIDINFPENRHWFGTLLTRAWQYGGDIVRDMGPLFKQFGFDVEDKEVGGFGSVHLYVATKRT